MTIPKLTPARGFAKRIAQYWGVFAWLAAAQSCVGPDLEPPGGKATSTPSSGLPSMPANDAGMSQMKPAEPMTTTPASGPTTAVGGAAAPMMTTPPALTPAGSAGRAAASAAGSAADASEDAGVPDAGTLHR